MQDFTIIGHRGASGTDPENTLRSVEAAITQGADMVEIDVVSLPSGEIILMHDDRVDRTTNGHGLVLDMSFDELRTLDAGEGEKIPTLQEVIEHINRRIPLVIEIKNPGSADAVATVLKDYFARGWTTADFIVSSFNHPELKRLMQLVPGTQSAALIYHIPLDYAAYCEPLQANICAPATDIITKEFVEDAHKRGLKLFAWVWQPVFKKETCRLYDLGIDGIYTDFPAETRGILTDYSTSSGTSRTESLRAPA